MWRRERTSGQPKGGGSAGGFRPDPRPPGREKRTDPEYSIIVWPHESPTASEKPVGIVGTWASSGSHSQAVRVRGVVMDHSSP